MIIALFTALVALQAIDAITTVRALRLARNVEANPAVRWLIKRIGGMPAMIAAKLFAIAVGAAIVLLASPRQAAVSLAALCLFYAGIAINNWRRMR